MIKVSLKNIDEASERMWEAEFNHRRLEKKLLAQNRIETPIERAQRTAAVILSLSFLIFALALLVGAIAYL